MERFHRRVAIGAFATAGDVDAMIKRLHALGITSYDRVLPPGEQQTPLDKDDALPAALGLSRLHTAAADLPMLRIYLSSAAEEQRVAQALLTSAARSVQLHDIDPPDET